MPLQRNGPRERVPTRPAGSTGRGDGEECNASVVLSCSSSSECSSTTSEENAEWESWRRKAIDAVLKEAENATSSSSPSCFSGVASTKYKRCSLECDHDYDGDHDDGIGTSGRPPSKKRSRLDPVDSNDREKMKSSTLRSGVSCGTNRQSPRRNRRGRECDSNIYCPLFDKNLNATATFFGVSFRLKDGVIVSDN